MKYKYLINPKYEHLTRFIQKIPAIYDREGMLVYDSHNQVRIYKEQDEKLVVKRFSRPKWRQRFDYTFSHPSRGKRGYLNAQKFLELGISTPEPIACIDEYEFGLFKRDYLITSFCGDPDTRVLRDEVEGHDDLVNALAQFLVDMHEKGVFHGNTNLSNFFYRKDADSPTGYHITTIDINRAKFVQNPTREECIGNLMRLTHIRPSVMKIIGRYAELRGWNVEWAVALVKQNLDAYDQKQYSKK